MVTILSTNIWGLTLAKDRTKLAQLADLATVSNSVAITLTEMWLTPSHEDAEVHIPGFVLHRADRDGRERGGAVLYVRDTIPVVPILQYSCGMVEVLALKARALESILYIIYQPPNSTPQELDQALDHLEEAIFMAQANSDKLPNLLGFGDLNLPEVQWEAPQAPQGKGWSARLTGRFLRFLNHHFQSQLVRVPTRGPNILDLVVTNNMALVSHIVVLANAKLSDHATLVTHLAVTLDPKASNQSSGNSKLYTSTIPHYNLSKADQEDWVRYAHLLTQSDWEARAMDLPLSERITLLISRGGS